MKIVDSLQEKHGFRLATIADSLQEKHGFRVVRIANFYQTVVRSLVDLRFVMALIAVTYVFTYFALPSTPGNNPHANTLGWWGWFDQGEYLRGAEALLHGDLTRDKYFYPPLYLAVGAVFLKWSSGHPYFLPNLLCLLWFVFVFIRFADRYVSRWSALLLLFCTIIVNHELRQDFVIPWTTTLSMALLATGILGLVWLEEVREGKQKQISSLQVFIVATSLGLLVPTRPLDAVVGAVFGLAFLIGYWRARHNDEANLPTPSRFLSLVVIGSAIGPAIYFVFNKKVFGDPLGGYIQKAKGNGFFVADLPEKFISLWLDGKTLYGVNHSGLTEHYPWLFITLAGVVWLLFRGDALLRVAAFAICLLFILYLPYGDLIPNGLWRYHSIHYFKWTFPFLALFAWLLVKQILEGWRSRKGWVLPVVLLIVIPSLLLSLHLAINVKQIRGISEPGQAMRFELPGGEVDFIDFKGLNGGVEEIYEGQHRLLLDGSELKRLRDYRLLSIGSNVRLLFIRPVTGRSIEFFPDPSLTRQDLQMAARAGVYRFALGVPKPFRNSDIPPIASTYQLRDIVDFSVNGNGSIYVDEGWSHPEVWGRWSLGDEARILMHISGYNGQELTLNMTYAAMVRSENKCQKVVLTGNGHTIATQELCLADGSHIPTLHSFRLPRGVVAQDGLLEIRIKTPDAITPKELGINEDTRILGVGLKTLQIDE